MNDEAPLVGIVGPTAAGKTALAVGVCRALGGEIVGCDASQIYRGLDIGTGKATAAELGLVPHHLIDVVPPDAPFDAAAYVAHADAAIRDIRARGRRPVVCGGTGLYLRALLHGLCEAPPVDSEVREVLRARLAAGEVERLHAELRVVDPEAAARIAPRDPQRIERALGVHLSTGRPLSAWQAEHRGQPPRYRIHLVAPRLPREVLNRRIEARVRGLFEAGFVDEVRRLRAQGYGAALRSLAALGYRLVNAHLDGETSLAEAIDGTIRATRQYAKRQMTWFGAVPGLAWLDAPVDGGVLVDWVRARDAGGGEP